MSSKRLNWVPTHSVIVARDNKQIDAFEATGRGKKAFKFTAEEIEEILAMSPDALRAPVEETADVTDDEEKQAAITPTPKVGEAPLVKTPANSKPVNPKDVDL